MAFWSSKVKDPVCGMEFDKKKASASVVHGGGNYFFCSPQCKQDFEKNPDRYTGKPATPAPGVAHDGGHH